MSRLFLSLYVFVAISIIVLGIGLEKILFNASPAPTPAQTAMLALTQKYQLDHKQLIKLLEDAGAEVKLLPLAQFSTSTAMGQALSDQETVEGIEDNAWVLLIPTAQQMVVHASFTQTQASKTSWLLYSALFFGCLGVMLAIWLAPIWRDLRRLTIASTSLQKDGTLAIPEISNRSPLQPLVCSYTTLNNNIQHLLAQHKALAGAITHEFKTPIARLKFALATAGNYQQAQIDAIHADIAELELLVQEMLDFTRLDTHEPDLHIEDIPLHDLCMQRVAKLQQHSHLQFDVQGKNIVLLADAALLARAIDNLLTNAARYAASNVCVKIKIEEQICVCVDDDGPGVSIIDKGRIFEPFYRADKHRARHSGGTGLGLAIVQRIMHWHNGTCAVSHSSLGGASFQLYFPLNLHRV